jgi:hypothetical protein
MSSMKFEDSYTEEVKKTAETLQLLDLSKEPINLWGRNVVMKDTKQFELPVYSDGFNTIVEKTFDIDIAKEYELLEGQLVINDALTPQTIRANLNRVEDLARRAHQIYTAAKVELDLFEIEATKVEAKMREVVIEELNTNKRSRSKTITESDVKSQMALSFPDEYVAIVGRRSKAQQTIDHLKRLADLFQVRSRTLNSLNNN